MRAALSLVLLVGCARAEASPSAKVDYAWETDLKAHDTLEQRFAPPAGYTRVKVESGSFGAFLRTLPLAAPSTPVVSYTGKTLHEATHANIAAVVAIDIGKADLQQCADSVIRMHAEPMIEAMCCRQKIRVFVVVSAAYVPLAENRRCVTRGLERHR